jgi:N-sulfoglucosamine sulfohydrolase
MIRTTLTNMLAAGAVTTVTAQISPTGRDLELPFRPNILVISCEDISPYLACYGDSTVRTPNIDRLAGEGVVFNNCFDVSGVSAPSRFSLITGMYGSSCGAGNMRTSQKDLPDGIPPYEAVPPPQVKCISEYLRIAGYYCTNNEKTDYQFTAPMAAWDECNPSAHWRNRPSAMPFFSIFNSMTTHESMIWTFGNDPLAVDPLTVPLPPYYPEDPVVRGDVARMYTNIAVMDREAGELLGQLEKAGLTDSTIIIFYSDNGGPLPRQKREIYDQGTHVPLIIRFPNKIFAGTRINDLVSFVDIPATILSLAGITLPGYMQGRAFWGKQTGESRIYVFAARDRMDERYDFVRSVRDSQFRYIRNFRPDLPMMQDISFRNSTMPLMKRLLQLHEQGRLDSIQELWFRKTKPEEELYDLKNDPFEIHNLAQQSGYMAVKERLSAALDLWMQEIRDNGFMTEKKLVWSMWPGGIQPVTEEPLIIEKDHWIEISCITEGASVVYQVNHKGYTGNHWYLYKGPFKIARGDTLSAKAHRIGFKESARAEYVFQ